MKAEAPESIPLHLRCDRCGQTHPTARSSTTAGVWYVACDPCREDMARPETPDNPREGSMDWLF